MLALVDRNADENDSVDDDLRVDCSCIDHAAEILSPNKGVASKSKGKNSPPCGRMRGLELG